MSFESGESSIYKYETGSAELKTLYDIMRNTDGIYGGRFSGAGFKGCCMALFDPAYEGKKTIPVKKILKGIITNPLIIGIVLGLPFSILDIEIPVLVDKSLDNLSSLATPLSLICLGAQFTFKAAKDNLKLSVTATVVKQLLIPSVVLLVAALLGFRGGELGAIFILFMAPTAISSYIMAKNMHSDDQLAAQILILTTLTSCFTLTAGIFLLRSLGLL